MRRRACVLLCVLYPGLGTGCPDDGPSEGPGSSGGTSDGSTTRSDTTLAGATTTAASESSSGVTTNDTDPVPLPARLGVTADWLARTLSVIDLDAIADGATTREDIVALTIVWETAAPGASFALGVAVDDVAGLAIMALPGTNVLSVQDLDGGEPRLVPWQREVGPTYVAIAPPR